LFRGKDPGGHARPAFVHTIEVPDTVITLNITFRGNWEMTATESMACTLGITGMFPDLSHRGGIVGHLFSTNRGGAYGFIGHS
jgi:hypothetical protein